MIISPDNKVRRQSMVSVPVHCPYCHSTEVIKAGTQANGTQRYQCPNERCARGIVLLHYQDRGRVPEVRRQVVDMALNGSGIRDTARAAHGGKADDAEERTQTSHVTDAPQTFSP
jgi:transposase-like protein